MTFFLLVNLYFNELRDAVYFDLLCSNHLVPIAFKLEQVLTELVDLGGKVKELKSLGDLGGGK